MKKNIHIMLVEDHPKYRKAIEMALADEPDMELTGTYGAAEIALRSLQDQQAPMKPDIILLDLNLPGMSGLEALPFFRKYIPEAPVVVLTQSDAEADVLLAIQSGAAGYLLKSSTVNQIKEGIRTVYKGESILDGKVAKYILRILKNDKPKQDTASPLSPRELEILTLLADGYVKKEISDRLDIGYGSVATYIRRIYEKLNVVNAPAAVAKAFKHGILSHDK